MKLSPQLVVLIAWLYMSAWQGWGSLQAILLGVMWFLLVLAANAEKHKP